MEQLFETGEGSWAGSSPPIERWRTILQTHQPERAVELLRGVYTSHTLRLPRGGGVQFCFDEFELGALHCGRLEYGCDVEFATTDSLDYLNLSVLLRGHAEFDGRVFSRGDAAAVQGDGVPRMRLSADAQLVNVRIDPHALLSAERLLQGDDGAPLQTWKLRRWIDAANPASRWLYAAVEGLARMPCTGLECDHWLDSRLSEGLLVQMLSVWPREGDGNVGSRTAGRSAVLRAMDYIESCSEHSPNLHDLVHATGVGVRSLHRAFVAHLGISPMRYVLKRRLERARQMLLSPRRGVTVAEVAMAQGFQNFGEFAAHYQRHFGELPRETRKKSMESKEHSHA